MVAGPGAWLRPRPLAVRGDPGPHDPPTSARHRHSAVPSPLRAPSPSCRLWGHSFCHCCPLPWLRRWGGGGRWALSSYPSHPRFPFFCLPRSLRLPAICPLLTTSRIPAPSLPYPLTSSGPRCGFECCVALRHPFHGARRRPLPPLLPRVRGAPVVPAASKRSNPSHIFLGGGHPFFHGLWAYSAARCTPVTLGRGPPLRSG